jgi:hypothetical protein
MFPGYRKESDEKFYIKFHFLKKYEIFAIFTLILLP